MTLKLKYLCPGSTYFRLSFTIKKIKIRKREGDREGESESEREEREKERMFLSSIYYNKKF